MNPECRDGKHGNCDGSGWDDEADAPGECTCTCHAVIGELRAELLAAGNLGPASSGKDSDTPKQHH